jgi:hypothetical protein
MKNTQILNEALVAAGLPVVTDYSLFLVLAPVILKGSFREHSLRFKRSELDQRRFTYFRDNLLKERYLRPDPDYDSARPLVFRVSDLPDPSAEDVAALIDPFCYVSHLSAMQRYGLTDRAPRDLSLTSPQDWASPRQKKVKDDSDTLGGEPHFFPRLLNITIPPSLRGRPVAVHRTKRTPVVQAIRESHARIAAIGEVFVQMLDRSDLCGGMPHVLQVWEQHAATYLKSIIEAVDRAPEQIVKVRAGYILSERLGITDEKIESWSRFAQRGGSRLLDPQQPYTNSFSEKWMISLNV